MDDLISKSSVLKGIEELQKSPWYNYGKELDRNFPFPQLEYIARKEAVIVIYDLCIKKEPAVDAAPVVHGRWTDKGSLSCRCSRCGCKSNAEYNYCPHCGAQMEGDDDETD